MNDQVVVHVVRYKDRPNWVMRYTDPTTGKQVAKSTGTDRRKDAEKLAAQWEADIRAGRYQKGARVPWGAFRDLFIEQHLGDLAPRSRSSYVVALNAFERVVNIQWLHDATTPTVSRFRAELRNKGLRPTTVANYLRHLAASLKWAQRHGMLAEVPDCRPPKGAGLASGMKGRPITTEEFDRMLTAVPKVVAKDLDPDADDDVIDADPRVATWKFYLRGLWLSGLRLSESLTLTWEDDPDAISVDLRGRRPMLRIPAVVEKGKKNRVLPITPDFAELLETVPAARRRGRVFAVHRHAVSVSQVVCAIGKQAGVKVTDKKFASAHDLRRAFGTRWSRSLSPARLKALMRHSDIATTMRYYVEEDSEELADALFQTLDPASGNVQGNAAQTQNPPAGRKPLKNKG